MAIDFHSHILPKIDDGSQSLEESLEMLRMSAEQGIDHIVATPHFYPNQNDFERFLRRRSEAEEKLRERMEKEQGLPEISIGSEVYFFQGISDSEAISQLTIGKKRYILIEMPESPWTDSMYRELEGISVKQGLTPVIAHVDRYITPFRSFGIPERLAELPVLVQANASFFLRRTTSGMAMRMLKKGQIDLLGSDCHNIRHRPPRLGEAMALIRSRLGERMIDRLDANGRQILEDREFVNHA